ncbi:orotidine-5'-phosphate decarboxylase [Microbacterium sp. STN6]|uniref:orotidine-5'-phosphate decarboxylase n=1 Tax=Microbacterium sp. STN6 TaxID=2995588 RepID=UPI002260A511|nr:orotidine-5'-phosphate decarboxylase [Microbacterium sp. STN6]MCX7521691.1 orotidine-5'-phosphate decarboxylase [Microbacterium sp. STN6]
MSEPGFGTRLRAAFDAHGALCVGIDPHGYLLSEWGLGDTASGAREFGLRVVDAAAGRAGIVKPQVAYFERFGSQGYRALEHVLAAARSAGLLVIADAKRGDIGSTVEAYGEAWLTPGSPLEADAMTLSPFLGVGSLAEPLRLAKAMGKGAFVLAATSNPEARATQRALTGGAERPTRTLARAIIEDVKAHNRDEATGALASIGVVIGATIDTADYDIDTTDAAGAVLPILAPGFGHQGARLEDIPRIFGSLEPGVIVSESRGLLAGGPAALASRIAERAAEVRAARAAHEGRGSHG